MPDHEPEPCRVGSCRSPLRGVGLDSGQSPTFAWWLLAWLTGCGLCHSPSSWCPLAGWAAAPSRAVALQLQRVILLIAILILITGKCPHTETQQLRSAVTQPRGETGHFSGAAGENSQRSMGRQSCWGGEGAGVSTSFQMSTCSPLCPPSSYYHPDQ